MDISPLQIIPPPHISYLYSFYRYQTRQLYLHTKMSDVTASIELPVIDISNPHDPDVGKATLDAAAKYGFLYVDSKGSDFTREDIDHAFDLVRIFHIAVMDF